MKVKVCCNLTKNHNQLGIYLIEYENVWELDYDGLTLHYCPNCGKKIEFTAKPSPVFAGDQNAPIPIYKEDNPLYRDSVGGEVRE